jgi:hypothetical protein
MSRPLLSVTAFLIALLVAGGGGVAADSFVAGIEDLPLMQGLEEDPEARVVFDAPGGRIVEARATGPLAPAAVADFYAAVLPQLGWRRAGDTAFRREGETLRLEITDTGRGVDVRFAVSPVGNGRSEGTR